MSAGVAPIAGTEIRELGTPKTLFGQVAMISQTAEYALRAVLYLGRSSGVSHTTQEISEGTTTPPGYLSKVLQSLSRAGLLRSQRGPHGGFTLSQDLRCLTLLQIVNAVDPIRRIDGCPLHIEGHDARLCPLHRRLDQVIETVEKRLGEITIQELVEEEARSKVVSACAPPPRGAR